MGYSLKDFCRDTTEILKTGASRQHVDKVKAQMERLLVDSAFVKEYFGDDQPLGLKRIHIDPQLGFEVMTYRYTEARKSNPHDHGDSWAIYGQVAEYTEMTEWDRLDDGSNPDVARLKANPSYRLTPGKAGVYYGRQLHSTQTPVGTRYLRVTGTDLENIERLRIDAATGKVQRIFGRQTGAPAAIAR
jgi:predicted metal-dependent enzyme (double-stranded beta helix superfamily)